MLLQAKNPHVYIGHQSHDTENEAGVAFSKCNFQSDQQDRDSIAIHSGLVWTGFQSHNKIGHTQTDRRMHEAYHHAYVRTDGQTSLQTNNK